MKYKKILAVFLMLVTVFNIFSFSASALNWDGSSAGGSTNSVNGSSKGYVVRSTIDSNCVVGYRFSVVNSEGNLKVNKVIDVFRNTTNGNNAYSTSAKFTTKYNKKQLIANKDAKLTTSLNTTNCYKEKDMGFVSVLPNPSGVETWQAYETNINKVLTKIGVSTVSNMVYGDKVIIEPLFDICLAGEYQALTVTEIAYCGRSVKGGSSDGGTSNGTSSTWGFIANYTNRIWPNKLYTPNGQGLWTAAIKIADSSKETFNNILSKGYGAGIAYNETANITYTIKFNGNGSTSGSTASMSMVKDVAKKLTANGFSKIGHSFAGWNKKSDGSGTSYTNQQSVKNLLSTQGATVNLYAQWNPYKLKVYYNANGGSITSDDYYLSSNNIYEKSTSAKYYQTWTYNSTKSKGLTNASTFGTSKTGYSFSGWGTSSTGGTLFDQDDTDIVPTDLNSSIKTGDCSVTLYAQWTPNKYTVTYNANGGSGAPSAQTKTHGVNLTLSSTKPTRTGYSFNGWNTKSDGSGTNYASGGTYSSNANVTLYAKWTPNTYTVTYNANGGTGAPSAQTKTYGVNLTLSSTKPTRTGYTFDGWNTKSDVSGTNYVSGGTYSSNANATLYAKWTPNTYTVTYNANGGTGAPSAQTKTYGVNLTLSSTKPTQTGYSFNGWNTKSDGTGINYASGGTYSSNANLTLYAKWTAGTYTVTYNANGGSGAPSSQTKTHGVNLTLSSIKPTRTGYTFDGWNTKSDGSGTNYASGSTYSSNSNATLYAQWIPITYTIKFDGNGSTSGSTSSMTMTYDEAKALTANGFKKTDHSFICWSIVKDGQGACYADKQSVKNMSMVNGGVVTLYAQWGANGKLSLESITPNAAYREGTDVITSFNLINESSKDCIPSDNVSVVFKAYKDSTVIKTVTKNNVVVPGNEKNLLYFKWTVPENIGSSNIYVSGEIVENGSSYSLVKRSCDTTKYTISSTPDTQYAINAPSGFTVPSAPSEKDNTAKWTEWTYADGSFKKVSYGIGISLSSPIITPDASANAKKINGIWTMKSGYGFGISVPNGVRSLDGYTVPSTSAYTSVQYATAQFPEFSYLTTINKFGTLELVSGKWIFRDNDDYGKIHFTPLWYPDGSYTVSLIQSDMWTPAGMISKKSNTNAVTISGSAYDDWYVH